MAFCIQVTVHELSHYFVSLAVGAKEGYVILHPFFNSQVIFNSIPNSNAQVLIGIAGPLIDIILATLIAIIAWKNNSIHTLPLLLWASIAFIGEGIGMITSVAAYPYWIEDITQLMRIGVSGTPIIRLFDDIQYEALITFGTNPPDSSLHNIMNESKMVADNTRHFGFKR